MDTYFLDISDKIDKETDKVKHYLAIPKEKENKKAQNKRYKEKKKLEREKLINMYGGIPIFDSISGDLIGTRQKWERIEKEKTEETEESLESEETKAKKLSILYAQRDKINEKIALLEGVETSDNQEISEEDWKAYCLENDLDEQGQKKL